MAILWKRELDDIITPMQLGNERIQCVEVRGNPNTISVYLPCRGSNNHFTELNECLDHLHEIFETFKNSHQMIIGGDLNENIYSSTNSQRKTAISNFMSEHKLSTVECGITFIHPSGQAMSAIDYILFQDHYKENVIKIEKQEINSNVSDHTPLMLSLKCDISFKKIKELTNTKNLKVN